MYHETIDVEDAGLAIGKEVFGAFTVTARCAWTDGPCKTAVFEGVDSITLSPYDGGKPFEIAVCLLPDVVRDGIDEAVRPIFEAYMDDADVSPADYREG